MGGNLPQGQAAGIMFPHEPPGLLHCGIPCPGQGLGISVTETPQPLLHHIGELAVVLPDVHCSPAVQQDLLKLRVSGHGVARRIQAQVQDLIGQLIANGGKPLHIGPACLKHLVHPPFQLPPLDRLQIVGEDGAASGSKHVHDLRHGVHLLGTIVTAVDLKVGAVLLHRLPGG